MEFDSYSKILAKHSCHQYVREMLHLRRSLWFGLRTYKITCINFSLKYNLSYNSDQCFPTNRKRKNNLLLFSFPTLFFFSF